MRIAAKASPPRKHQADDQYRGLSLNQRNGNIGLWHYYFLSVPASSDFLLSK